LPRHLARHDAALAQCFDMRDRTLDVRSRERLFYLGRLPQPARLIDSTT
jgi:hypothetical protein